MTRNVQLHVGYASWLASWVCFMKKDALALEYYNSFQPGALILFDLYTMMQLDFSDFMYLST